MLGLLISEILSILTNYRRKPYDYFNKFEFDKNSIFINFQILPKVEYKGIFLTL